MARVKNITLVTLIIISVLLFSRVWFGNDFISVIKENMFFLNRLGEPSVQTFAVKDIISPTRIVVTGGGKRSTFLRGQKNYENLCEELYDALDSMKIKKDEFLSADEDEWVTALKSSSVLMDFGNMYDSSLLSELGITLPDGTYKNIVFAPSDTLGLNPSFYAKNESGEIYKFFVKGGNNKTSAVIEQYLMSDVAGNHPFAFELGFDKVKTNAGISQNILLDSNIVMGLAEQNEKAIAVKAEEKNISPRAVEELLYAFKFNINTTRRYIGKDDVIVLVDNNATLKIYPSYMIEYTAENGGYEIDGDEGEVSSAEVLGGIYTTMREVFRAFDVNGIPVASASDIGRDFEADTEILFDYYVNGTPIFINSDGKVHHAATVKIKDGTVVSYRQYICNVEETEESVTLDSMINALDRLYEHAQSEKEVKVEDIFVAYTLDESITQCTPVWCAKTEENIIIIN